MPSFNKYQYICDHTLYTIITITDLKLRSKEYNTWKKQTQNTVKINILKQNNNNTSMAARCGE